MTDQPPDLKAGLNCISKKFDLYQTSAKIQADMQNEIGLRYYSGKIKWIQILLFSAFFLKHSLRRGAPLRLSIYFVSETTR